MTKSIIFRKKYLLIIIPIIILLAAIAIIIANHNTNKISNDRDISKVPYKTEKQPIANRFSKIGKFDICYWKAHTIGRTDFGPTSYWMKGFAVLSKNDFERLKKSYEWKAKEANWKPELNTEILKLKTFSWYESEGFNFDTKEGSLTGLFYLDFTNGVIYFDIEK